MQRITAVYETPEQAECAIEKLQSIGISATLSTVQSNKIMSILQQDMARGSSRGVWIGTVLGAVAGLVESMWTALGPIIFSGVLGVVITVVFGAMLGAVIGSTIGTALDLRQKAHREAVQASSMHEGKPMVAVDVDLPEDVLKVEDILKTLGGELVTTTLPAAGPAPAQLLH